MPASRFRPKGPKPLPTLVLLHSLCLCVRVCSDICKPQVSSWAAGGTGADKPLSVFTLASVCEFLSYDCHIFGQKTPQQRVEGGSGSKFVLFQQLFVAFVVAGSYPLNFLAINRTFGPPKTMKPLKKRKLNRKFPVGKMSNLILGLRRNSFLSTFYFVRNDKNKSKRICQHLWR